MKIVRLVPVFNRKKKVEVFVPQFSGFSEKEEIRILEQLSPLILNKRWAFCEHAVPDDYLGVMVTQNSGEDRFVKVRESGHDVIGYEFEIKVGLQSMLDWCYAIAIDMNYENSDQLLRLAELYSGKHIRKIALCVCSNAEFDICLKQGFEFMIGDFYTKTVISDRGDAKLHPVKANKLAILSEVMSWEADFAGQNTQKVLDIIQRDMFITLALIKLSNSPMFGGKKGITSLKDAIIRIGYKNLKVWIMSLLPGSLADEETPEITKVALLRAKFMENLAEVLNLNPLLAFYTGMLSLSGIMLGIPAEAAIRELGAPDEIMDYLKYQGDIGQLFGLAESYISGENDRFRLYSRSLNVQNEIFHHYINAELWVYEMLRATTEVLVENK